MNISEETEANGRVACEDFTRPITIPEEQWVFMSRNFRLREHSAFGPENGDASRGCRISIVKFHMPAVRHLQLGQTVNVIVAAFK